MKYGVCIGSVSGISMVVFRKALGGSSQRLVVAAGPEADKVWTFDPWSNSFVAVDLPVSSRELAREIVDLYSLDASASSEAIEATMTKEMITYRLP